MSRRPSKLRSRKTRLECESLETRALLSGSSMAFSSAPSILALLPSPPTSNVSTVPSNGDQNPYGLAGVPRGFLVANFNNGANLQGTGTTIVRINKDGSQTLFFAGQPGLGLTGALNVLSKGYVLVGSVPTTDGTSNTVQQGSLLIINRFGQKIGEVKNQTFLDGPWGMAVNDQGNTGQVWISNVLNGTITRLNYKISNGQVLFSKPTTIASGYSHTLDPAAVVIGPAGLVYDKPTDTLYVASENDNEIFSVSHASSRTTSAGTGNLVYQDQTHLHGPLDIIIAPNGNLITANADSVNVDPNQPSELVEFTKQGKFVNQLSIDPSNGGAFGLWIKATNAGFILAATDDVTGTLQQWVVLANKPTSSS